MVKSEVQSRRISFPSEGRCGPAAHLTAGRKSGEARSGADSSPVSQDTLMAGLPYPADALELTSQTHPDEALAS